MKAHDILTIEDRITILPQKLAEISSQLTQAQTERKAMETVYLSVKDVLQGEEDPLTLPVINGDAMIKSLNQKILETRQHIMELSKKYGPKHALMRNADSELAMLTENRDQEIQRIIKSIQNEYELAKSTEENMQAMLSDIKADTVELNERFIQYNILKREVETNRNMYDALVSRIKEQSVHRADSAGGCLGSGGGADTRRTLPAEHPQKLDAGHCPGAFCRCGAGPFP